MSSTPAVVALDLVKRFGDNTAVDHVSFVVPQGTVLGLLGPNGAGKTTTVRMLTTLSVPTSGTGRVAGHDVVKEPDAVRRSMGLTGQAATVDELLTGRENLRLIGRLSGLSRRYVAEATDSLLERFALSDAANRTVKTYSGGMRRRLDLAASLVGRPEVLFLDEPTTGLDPQARQLVWDRLYRLKQRGTTLVLTTHYMDEAEQLCDRLVVMDGGRIAAEGSPSALIHEWSTREVVELRFPPGENDDAAEKVEALVADPGRPLGALVDRVEVLPDRVLLYAHDGDEASAELHRQGVTALSVLVRRSTLEDVFLRLTGRTLVD